MPVISGIRCTKDVPDYFRELKTNRKYRYVIYRVRCGTKERFVALEKAGDRDATFRDFVTDLPKTEARFAVYDFSYMTPDWGMKDGILFIYWSPYQGSNNEYRTIYAATKSTILANLRQGTSLKSIQVTDIEDLTEPNLMDALLPYREKGIDLKIAGLLRTK